MTKQADMEFASPSMRRTWIQNFLILGAGLTLGVLLSLMILIGPDRVQSQLAVALLPRRIPAPAIGHPAPDFVLESLSGNTVHLSELQGHPILLNFWATWCGPCRQEMPLLAKYHQSQPDLVMLAVNAGEERDQVKAFRDEFGLMFDVLLDPEGRVQSLYDIRGYPTTFFLDERGIVRAVVMGALDETSLPRYLEKVGVGP